MNKRTIALLLLFLVASLLRFYRFEEFTEFLGDQGRTGIIIWNAWTSKTLPLVGPSVLSGQYLGPFFYYFIAFPFILFNFHPLIPALWIASLGIVSVYLIFYLGEKLFNFWIGLAIAGLYAVSPYVLSSDRILWEPNIIPFFVLLYILCVYIIQNERKFVAFLPMGVLVGILVQLHYPNVFFIVLSVLFSLYMLITRKRQESLSSLVVWILAGFAGFIVILSPFLYYEAQHNWKDFKEILIIFFPSGSALNKRLVIYSFFDYSSRLFYRVFSFTKSWIMIPLELSFIAAALAQRKFWGMFFGLWFVAGVAAMSLYRGIVFDHYLNFLTPLPFFLFGVVMSLCNKYVPRLFWISLIILAVIFQLRNFPIYLKEQNDISRTKNLVAEMIRRTAGEPFSFALISSRSFSDLHYRYFFLRHDNHPLPVTEESYRNLFLICEKWPCLSLIEMKDIHSVKTICNEEHCGGEYPTIRLDEWQLIATFDGFNGRMYIYRRKSLLNT